jgi:hypothetical protein
MSPFLLKKLLFAPEKHKPQQYYLRHLKADVKTTPCYVSNKFLVHRIIYNKIKK